ncbi:MAG: von Willebrand factor, type [Chthonomonadaceae bacterium]|nr:von Willebrand factor, type [Chthonomonadaceae bacterium]
MAEFGGGHYYFIESPNQIPTLFRQELGELMTVVARRAQLEVAIPKGTALTLLGEIPHAAADGSLRIPLGDLFAGEKRVFYFEALTPTASQAAEQIFPFDLLWSDAEGVPTEVTQAARFAYAAEAEVKALPADTELRARAVLIRAAAAERTALKLADEGSIDAAIGTLDLIITKYGAMLGPQKTTELIQLRTSIHDRTLSVLESKARHHSVYSVRASRSKR